LAAPTGSGKTLAAFLVLLDRLYREGVERGLPDETRVLYLSPLRALSSDVERNLLGPLSEIRQELEARGDPPVEIRTHVRTGDTRASERRKVLKLPPHIYVTTPESFYVLLTSESGRKLLRTVETVIVDEIHALLPDKRGSHLALSLERLEALTGRFVQRIGLSATQKPMAEVARFLAGAEGPGRAPEVIDLGHTRARDLDIVVPGSPLEAVMSGEVWEEVYASIVELILLHKTTLVFVNTRRLCERLARHLGERLGADNVTAHHGSLAREHRLRAEQRLKSGELRALVATASLELGIDVGDVELVVQVGGARSISTFLQRVGRSGHFLAGVPKGRIFPLSRDELLESVALCQAVRKGQLEQLSLPVAPLDILAQQIVAAVAAEGEWQEEELFNLCRGAYPYRALERTTFDAVIEMLAQGFSTSRGRRAAHIFRDEVARVVRPRRGARLLAMTSGGAIPDVADYEVLLEPEGLRVGSVHEDFAIESMAGDVFQLGNASYAIRRVEPGRVRVVDARGAPPTLPFWLGEAPSRSSELSLALAGLRIELGDKLRAGGPELAQSWLESEHQLSSAVASQVATYLHLSLTALGALPTQDTLVLERFFDEVGSMHLVLHAPFGGRLLRGYGLALRKCFCRKFDFELQAAANDDAILLSLGPTHSFPLEEVFGYLRSSSLREVLIQALLVAPLFTTRFRWNAQRALAIPRFRGGKRIPPRFQRMDADDLLTTCFPDQVACAENLNGEREVPDHPLVNQTVIDAITEAVDLEGLAQLIGRIERNEIQLIARDVTEPSPLAASVLTAKPYAFLDDAPLEERRVQAVLNRRWLDLRDARVTSLLNPEAIVRVVAEAWPSPRSADELCDALETYGFLTAEEGEKWGLSSPFQELVCAGRAIEVDPGCKLWIGRARLPDFSKLYPSLGLSSPANIEVERQEVLTSILGARLAVTGPIVALELARQLSLDESEVLTSLVALESTGAIFRGQFRAAHGGEEWCERRLLSRIHRLSVERLRAEIEPVSAQDFVRFLFAWQGLEGDARGSGRAAVKAALSRLEGFEAAASAWEGDILPARVADYDPAWLDELCLSGQLTWFRRARSGTGRGPVRTTPLIIAFRERAHLWRKAAAPSEGASRLGADAERLVTVLERNGACFYTDLGREARLLPTQVEQALAELVARGLVTSDSFSGLRALLTPERVKQRNGARPPRYAFESAGRWTLLGSNSERGSAAGEVDPGQELGDLQHERLARTLLERWGVVFRQVLEREEGLPPFRELLSCYRTLEARGEVRGGRFVAGFAGEQYALPEAVTQLRKVRSAKKDGALVSISAADPLNLVGILLPGERVPVQAKNRLVFRDGLCVATRSGSTTEIRDEASGSSLRTALVQRQLHPAVRGYLGQGP